MEYKNIMPNPLTSLGFINFNYNNSNYATSDFNGIQASEVYKNIRSIIAMKNIPEDMYLPALGELGIALENISYINSRIPNKENKFDLNSKYMSTTPYYEYNINNDHYNISHTINNIWYADLSRGYISYSNINDYYNIMPLYKYTPFENNEEDEDESNKLRQELLKEIDPNLIISSVYGDPYTEDKLYSNDKYFCNNLNNYVSSFLFNYRNINELEKIGKNNKLKFRDIIFNLPQEIWQVSHINKNISLNYKNYSPYAKEGSYEFDFCIVLPDFDYMDNTYEEAKVISFKCDAGEDDEEINTKNILIHANFGNIEETDFYPINNNQTMNDCVIFEMDNHIYLTEEDLRNCEQHITVKFEFYYKKDSKSDYSNFMFEKVYYFDIHNLVIYGNGYTGMINNYANVQLVKTNIAKSKEATQYISYSMNPILVKEKDPLNVTYFYSTYNLPGIRVNRLNESNIKRFSYEMPELGKTVDLGMKSIYNFYNNGVMNSQVSSEESEITYFYKGYGLEAIYGNNDIVFSTKYINMSSFLRTFRETDEFGIYNDCIINSLIGLDTNETNNIQNAIKQESDTIVKYKVTNLPVCGSKQYIMFTPYNPGNNLLFNSFYLFIANTTSREVSISIEDLSYTLCKRKTIIILKPGTMKLYYPAIYDYSYKIKISSIDNNFETYKVYNMFSLATYQNRTNNVSVWPAQIDLISKLYQMKDNVNLTDSSFDFLAQDQPTMNYFSQYEYNLELTIDYYPNLSRCYLININYSKDYICIAQQFNMWEE